MTQFKQLPSPYSKYEVSESGSILRAIKTKSIVNLEKGTQHYRIYSDSGNGVRITLKKSELQDMASVKGDGKKEEAPKEKKMLLKKPKAEKKPKEQKPKKEKITPKLRKAREWKKGKQASEECLKEVKAVCDENKSLDSNLIIKVLELPVSDFVKAHHLTEIGLTKDEVAKVMQTTKQNVARNLWLIQTGRREKPSSL